MAEQNEIVAKLILDSQQADNSVKSFKTQLREAQQALLGVSQQFGEGSKEAVALSKHIAGLKDEMGDAKALVDAFNPDRKFQAFSATVQGVAGGFSALQGVMALVGAESESVEKSLLKVQSALAISQGVNSILELKDTFKQLGIFIQSTTIYQKANSAATATAALVQKLFAGAVDTTSTSFKVLKGAIIATGIGALIVLLGFVIEKINSLSSASESAAEAQKRLKEEVEHLNEALQDQIGFSDRAAKETIASAKARGVAEKDITSLERKAIEDRIYLRELNLQDIKRRGGDEFKAQKELQNEIQNLRIFDLEKQAELRKKAEEEEKKRLEKSKQGQEKRKQELKEQLERERTAEEELAKMREENYLLEEKDEVKRGRSKIIIDAENEKERIKQLRVSEELRLKLLDEVRRNERDQLAAYDLEEENKQKEKDAEKLKSGLQLILDQAKIIQEQTALQNELRTELADTEKSEFELQLQELDLNYKRKLAIVGSNEALYTQLVESYEKQRSAIVFMQGQQRLSIVSGLLGKAADLLGKQTAAGKVLAIAEAVINTYAGATAALRSKVPFPEPVATGIRIAQAALIVATGLKSIREIAKAKVPGGGGDGGASASLSSVSAPIASAPTIQTTQLDQESINNIGNATVPVRAYVVESDVTDNQEKVARLNRAAILGGN
jgi:hypothetical protein